MTDELRLGEYFKNCKIYIWHTEYKGVKVDYICIHTFLKDMSSVLYNVILIVVCKLDNKQNHGQTPPHSYFFRIIPCRSNSNTYDILHWPRLPR